MSWSQVVSFLRTSTTEGGLLIDMDGTLVNSEPANQAAYRDFFADRGWHLTPQMLRSFTGRTGADSFRDTPGPWHEEGLDYSELAQTAYSYVDLEKYPPIPVAGAKEFVASFSRACVVTSAMRWWARSGVELAGLSWEGLHLVSAEDVTVGKPHPEPYQQGAKKLELAPVVCVAVEDTPPGVKSARAAGVGLVLGVTTSFTAADLVDAGAHATIPDFVQIAAAL
ncbi:MAG: HAD-IA family hydrolase [Buchananella hordeovulneris]|nr:HAD-IA family hydrolase [Buchananella hordeovulneris]